MERHSFGLHWGHYKIIETEEYYYLMSEITIHNYAQKEAQRHIYFKLNNGQILGLLCGTHTRSVFK